jgi:hypothetical protein
VSAVIDAFGPKETGDFRAVTSKALAAQAFANATAQQLMAKSAESAAGGKLLGWTDEEHMAIVAELSKTLGIEKAGTGASQFELALTKEESMGGKPLPEQLAVYKQGKFTEAQIRKDMGEELFASLEAALPSMSMKDGKKTVKPFKGLTVKEALTKGAEMTEAEAADAFGPFAAEINAVFEKNTAAVGKTLMQTLAEIRESGLSPEQLAHKFPKKAVVAMGMLTTDEAYGRISQTIQAQIEAERTDRAGATAKLSREDPSTDIPRQLRIAQAKQDISREAIGKAEGIATAAIQEYDLALKDAGVPFIVRFGGKKILQGEEKLLGLGGPMAGPEHVVSRIGTPEQRAQFAGIKEEEKTGYYDVARVSAAAEAINAADRAPRGQYGTHLSNREMEWYDRAAKNNEIQLDARAVADMQRAANTSAAAADKFNAVADKMGSWFGGAGAPRAALQGASAGNSGVDRR